MSSIAVIGGGKIGEALIVGLINGGINPKNIHVTNREPERNQYLRDKYAVLTFDDNILAVDGADVVFLCVKPKVVASVVEEISDRIDNNEATTVVSMAAGISIAVVEEGLAAGAPVIRVMPNTPMLVGAGMCAMAVGRFVEAEQLARVKDLLSMVGAVRVVDEHDMDAVTAMSGCRCEFRFNSGCSSGIEHHDLLRCGKNAIGYECGACGIAGQCFISWWFHHCRYPRI